MEEDLKILEEQLNTYKRHLKNYEKQECLTSVYYALKEYAIALENIIKRYKDLEQENKEYEATLDIFDNRKYRKRYLEERRAEEPNLLYPDADEIYKRYYELLEEIKNSIPKSKIEEKIKELEREFDFYAGREHFEWQDGEFDGEVCDDIALKIGVLKKLLESEENK